MSQRETPIWNAATCASSRDLPWSAARTGWPASGRLQRARKTGSGRAALCSWSMVTTRGIAASSSSARWVIPKWPISTTSRDCRARARAFGAVDRAQVERYNSRRFLSGILRLNMDAQERIKQQVTGNPVVLYMKGTPQFPQCGFSANAVQILKACGVEQVFTVNVLEEPEIRQGIKEYANWPTIPQLYVNGEFVGGSDIMREMYQSGELQKLLTGEKTTS